MCPICNSPLFQQDKSYYCEKRHCYDIAKSGYVNLLQSDKMNSKIPGDNKQMVDTRNHFLNKGYYSSLCDKLCEVIAELSQTIATKPLCLADVGCGEGYYTNHMAMTLAENNQSCEILGIDISKFALELAGKFAKTHQLLNVHYGVGSVFRLPIADQACDIVTELFAPYCGEEFHRILKPNGYMILVIPAKNHLFELKQAIYENPYKNEIKPYELEGFQLIKKHEVTKTILLEENKDIQNLFHMTPYAYKTSIEDTQKLEQLCSLSTTISFEILCYQKKHK